MKLLKRLLVAPVIGIITVSCVSVYLPLALLKYVLDGRVSFNSMLIDKIVDWAEK